MQPLQACAPRAGFRPSPSSRGHAPFEGARGPPMRRRSAPLPRRPQPSKGVSAGVVYYPSVRSPDPAARAARAGKSGKGLPGIRQPPPQGLLASAAQTMTKHGAAQGQRRECIRAIIGMKVVSTEGKILGKINDISMEMQSWKMPSLAIAVPRGVLDELKTKKPVLGKGKIILSMVHIKSIKDYVMLDTDYQGLSRILETATVKAQ
ncbi:MAG: PRC-barrel domain-containing protein [Thermoplasmatota archaeon]